MSQKDCRSRGLFGGTDKRADALQATGRCHLRCGSHGGSGKQVRDGLPHGLILLPLFRLVEFAPPVGRLSPSRAGVFEIVEEERLRTFAEKLLAEPLFRSERDVGPLPNERMFVLSQNSPNGGDFEADRLQDLE